MVALRQEKQSPASINRKLSALKSFYKYLLREKQVNKNPTDGITSLKKPQKLPVFFRENEIDAAIGSHPAEENDFTEARKHIILEILYQTGIRRAELLGIKNSDFNFFSLTLRVTGKGNKERVIPISKELKKKIQSYLILKEEYIGNTSYFIVTDKGEQAYPNFIYRIVKESMGQVSTQDKRSPHVMRHSFASSLLNNGADINAVKELLGHANLSATQIYTHTSFEQLKESYKKAHPRK
jgi:integrase/recombinase XerC